MDNFKRLIIGVSVIVLFVAAIIFLLVAPWGREAEEVLDIDDPSNLVEFANTETRVRFTTRGRINSQQEHHQVQITVGRDTVNAELHRGYREAVLKSERYGNNPDAYEVFLAALMNLNFTETKDPPQDTEVLGACPRQQQYFFEILDGNEVIHEAWSTRCSSRIGNYDGRLTDTIWLFRQQVPDYYDIVRGIRL